MHVNAAKGWLLCWVGSMDVVKGSHSHGAAVLDVQQLLAPGAYELLKVPL